MSGYTLGNLSLPGQAILDRTKYSCEVHTRVLGAGYIGALDCGLFVTPMLIFLKPLYTPQHWLAR